MFEKTYRFHTLQPGGNENQDLVTNFCFLGGWVCKIEIMEF